MALVPFSAPPLYPPAPPSCRASFYRGVSPFYYCHYNCPTKLDSLSSRQLNSGGGLITNAGKTANSSVSEINGRISGSNTPEIMDYVEVFGIGSRKDAVFDFCLNSQFLSPALRFWNILVKDETKVQLQQRFPSQDITSEVTEASTNCWPCSKAFVLVASAAYGSDDIAALDILRAAKSKKFLVVGIILRPFDFEGRRRKDEVMKLVDVIKEQADFCIDVDTNALLDNDMVTLDEAVKMMNNAVLMATNAIPILISEKHVKLQHATHNGSGVQTAAELQKILKDHNEAKIGFGAGFSVKSSVIQAVYDCPFLNVGVKDSSGKVICILASSGIIDDQDSATISQVVHTTIGCREEVIVSVVCEPKLELNLIRTTILAFGCLKQQPSKKSGIISRLAQHFPFLFSILNKQSPQPQNTKGNISEYQHASGDKSLEEYDPVLSKAHFDGISEDYSAQTISPLQSNRDKDTSFRRYEGALDGSDIEFSNTDSIPLPSLQNAQGAPPFEGNLITKDHVGADNQNFLVWTTEDAPDTEATLLPDSVSIYRLPVGVKSSQISEEFSANISRQRKQKDSSRKILSDTTPSVSWDGITDRGLEATMNFIDLSKSRKRNNAIDSNKQGALSNRAASMLEAERDSPNKKWSPVLEIQYRGGIYRGRIQGGLPEGKGCLSLEDGSIYDGMWRSGKRSGLGTLYFSNGDVFQGSWRDDVMHGKGWFYFHTGDRWFVNFWKGKANGEGRFYSKLGDVFFGHFKDGWRHGYFLCIGVDGTRWHEVWEDGVLVSRKQLFAGDNGVA
ncbi:OLC1v1033069C1 [Oldenlandia corymbosa var. corymbosa]|uniref:OLC1v1033069C1 n=1 Tax=Oldenlandia corymbosa var. corymbosa TaxID=529605 RepID=A0AAV1CN72_OLDCO|nr:OLC1v1033069C1 [Oldenlandia corymbosa var. corymbosa]